VRIVEEASKNLLYAFLVGVLKFGTCVDRVSSLIVFVILDWIWVLGAILQLCKMLMLVLEFLYVWQRMQALLCQLVFPCKRDTTIEVAHPIFNNVVHLCPKGSKKVLEVFATNVFNAKIVHTQIEPDGS
jgi:hypothetical protein